MSTTTTTKKTTSPAAWDIRQHVSPPKRTKVPERNVACFNRHARLIGDMPFKRLFTMPFSELVPAALEQAQQGSAVVGLDTTSLDATFKALKSHFGGATLQDLLSKSPTAFSAEQLKVVRAARKAGLALPMPTSDPNVQSLQAKSLQRLLHDAPQATLKSMVGTNGVSTLDQASAAAVRQAQQSGVLPNKTPVPPASPTLANCQVSFHTNDEDKDDDTHVTVSVFDGNNTLCAIISNDFGHFNDHSDEGPFGLSIQNPSTSDALQRGNVIIRIDPNGHDTWRFNFTLDLHFSDNSHLGGSAFSLELTQDRQQQQFGISGLIPD